jgi:carbon monoxide dehydrogenase subunit G
MGSITRETEIAAPPEVVWSVLEDIRALPDVSPSTEAVEDAPARLTAPGQTYVQVGRILGRRMRSQWTVKALEPARYLRSEGDLGLGARYCLTQTLTPVDQTRTKVAVTIDYKVPGGALGRLAAKAAVESRVATEAQTVLDGVRRVAEAKASGTS